MFSWLICIGFLIFSTSHPEADVSGYMLISSGLFAIAGNIAMYANKTK